VRRLPAVVLLVAVCTAAAGCTTVSAAPPRRPAPRPADPDRPDDLVVAQSPAHEVLDTARPDRPATEDPARTAPGSAARPYAPPARHRDRWAPPRHGLTEYAAPTAGPTAVPVPGGTNVCALGETYGGWAAGSQAARICRQAYGR
jgi:hypothetical protein